MNDKNLYTLIIYNIITYRYKREIMLKTQISLCMSFILRHITPPSEKKISKLSQIARIRHKFFSRSLSSVELGRKKIEKGQYTQALNIFEECLRKRERNETD